MTGGWVLGIAALVGMAVTLAVIIGLVLRIGGLKADREFRTLRRPENLSDFPFVTIVVPARNEEPNIGPCLESLLALDYPRFEILVVDDHSTDRTTEIVREIIGRRALRQDVRLMPLGDDPAEKGTEWVCGKSRALWNGAQRAHGDWILFVDADTRQKPDTLWRVLALARRHDLRALSLTGVSVIPGIWGEVLEAVVYPAIFLAISWRRVNDPDDPAAWMNGQFVLYERAAYFAVDGHRAIAGFVSDDTGLAIHSKQRGVRSLFLPVTSAYESRDFAGLGETFRGWTRRLAVGGARLRLRRLSYAVEAGVLFIFGVWPVLALAAGLISPLGGRLILGVSFSAWALAQLGLVVLAQGAGRALMKKSVWPAVLAPAGAALGIGVVVAGYWARFVKRSIEFRGRAVAVNDDAG
jgi:glycosyltransferase involved in cell wall biosynthesis